MLLTVGLSLLMGCSVSLDVTVHDEDKAADLARVFLEQIKSEAGMKVAYDNAHKELREYEVFEVFFSGISQLLKYNAGSTISIFGYETMGTNEAIFVYAKSIVGGSNLYYRFTFIGSKSKGYKLLNFNANSKGYEYKGSYSNYVYPIGV